jgi:DNA-binding response OmpR family regulator
MALDAPPLRILVVEDDDDIVYLLASALRAVGYRVNTARQRDRALDVLRRYPVDLIIADSVLRGGNGDAIAARAGTRDIPVILISGEPDRIRRLSRGPVPFLAKPFPIGTMLALVRQLVG